MAKVRLITAIGTPLEGPTDELCVRGLEEHFDDQATAGVEGILVAGTMGAQQMVKDEAWRTLMRESARLSRGRFELLAGVTDQSLARVFDRIAFVESLGSRLFAGHVVLMPSAFALSEAERVDFYTAIADAARLPVFLYELAPVPGGTLSLSALVGLARHPNIAGIKISAGLAKARRLHELVDRTFRVIPADPQLLDFCAVAGPWTEHLDGIFAACPRWAVEVRDEAARGNAAAAARAQAKINGLLQQWIATGQIFAAFTATMNARGISGRYHPRPMRGLPDDVAKAMLASAELAALMADPNPPLAQASRSFDDQSAGG